jgi:hypothetical protein
MTASCLGEWVTLNNCSTAWLPAANKYNVFPKAFRIPDHEDHPNQIPSWRLRRPGKNIRKRAPLIMKKGTHRKKCIGHIMMKKPISDAQLQKKT